MAVVLPLIAMYGGVTAGMAMAATGVVTLGGALAVAGGMMSGLGLVSGNKKMQKIGSALAIASSISNMAQGAMEGAGEASSAWDASGSAEGSDAAMLKSRGVAQAAQGSTLGQGMTAGADTIGNSAMTGIDAAGNVQAPMGGGLSASLQSPGPAPTAAAPLAADATIGVSSGAPTSYSAGIDDVLQRHASSMTWQDVGAFLKQGAEKAKASLMDQAMGNGGATGGVTGWIKENPMAAKMLFDAAGSAYGPEAEALDYKKSLMERARNNLNSPVRLRYLKPATTTGG